LKITEEISSTKGDCENAAFNYYNSKDMTNEIEKEKRLKLMVVRVDSGTGYENGRRNENMLTESIRTDQIKDMMNRFEQ
jgi:hypothetical protein